MKPSRTQTQRTIAAAMWPRVVTAIIAMTGTAVGATSAGPAAAAAARSQRVIITLRNQNQGLPVRSPSRRAAASAQQAPLVAGLNSAGARDIRSLTLVNAVIATVPSGQESALAANPAVEKVIPDTSIPGASPARPGEADARSSARTSGTARKSALAGSASAAPCGTAASPELDPQALTNVNDTPSQLPAGIDGAGVTVAYLADGVDLSNPDFQRNAAYASPGSPAGSRVITQHDFSGDPAGTPDYLTEAFLDASSIAAQGNETYDISKYVSPAHPLPSGCDIKIVGAAPGANVMALKVFSENNWTSLSKFVQAIEYAVANGAKVINESFSSNNFPDTALDFIRHADEAAVAAGVTVVVASGDAGITSTIGSPASDPAVIGVGASTTFRWYRQVTYGGINEPRANGRWVDDNISALSSGGFTQSGRTVDLVAPGDVNWMLCSPDVSHFPACYGEPIEGGGGTSEAAPLTAGAAADVIQAYASTHGGSDPSPALVKQILASTATDIGAPATQQGAGLLNVQAAVKEAESISGTSATPGWGLQVSPNQINVAQQPGDSSTQPLSVTNTGSSPVNVNLSTRALSDRVSDQSGSFCMQPGEPTAECPANTGAFEIWNGLTEVYQEQTFTVPATTGRSRLKFASDYRFSGQTSPVHVALLEPDGTYAAYSEPQGVADYAEVQVANPPAGTWTAVFFTAKDGARPGVVGSSGPVQWNASTDQYAPAGAITPSSLQVGAGQTATAHLELTSPSTAGDSEQSVVVSSPYGQTTIPVTLRTIVPTSDGGGGTFGGLLTGGNGRGGFPEAGPAQTNTYYFNVPRKKRDLEASVTLANDPGEALIAFLVDPHGQTVGYSSNFTVNEEGNPVETRWVTVYHVAPEPGQWKLVLLWLNPVTGNELNEPFTGTIGFNQVRVQSDLPEGPSTKLKQGQAYTFHVHVTDTGVAPESFFLDPRLVQPTTIRLPNQNAGVNEERIQLPLPFSFYPFPIYFVPTHTTELQANLTSSVPITFDMRVFTGDPLVSPALSGGPVTGSQGGDLASLMLTEPEIAPGQWALEPDEIGPYPASGEPAATASASVSAATSSFDPTVTSVTGDLWSQTNGLSSTFAPVYVPPGKSADIAVSLTPTAAPNTKVSGTLYVDDVVRSSVAFTNGDELAAIPYEYQVKQGGAGSRDTSGASRAWPSLTPTPSSRQSSTGVLTSWSCRSRARSRPTPSTGARGPSSGSPRRTRTTGLQPRSRSGSICPSGHRTRTRRH